MSRKFKLVQLRAPTTTEAKILETFADKFVEVVQERGRNSTIQVYDFGAAFHKAKETLEATENHVGMPNCP